jgi:propionyl-CoA synthetase
LNQRCPKRTNTFGFVVTKIHDEIEHFQLEHEIIHMIRQQIELLPFRNVVIVNRLPKTRSGKILRKLMRSIADGEQFQIPSTIDDETIIDEIKEVLKNMKLVLL